MKVDAPKRKPDGTPPPPTDTFHISFDTKSMPGKILVTTVTLREEIHEARDGAFDPTVFRPDLTNHPLYRRLRRYVFDNERG
jgi:hypothetical protein